MLILFIFCHLFFIFHFYQNLFGLLKWQFPIIWRFRCSDDFEHIFDGSLIKGMVILDLLFVHMFEYRIETIMFPNMFKVINCEFPFLLISSKPIEQEPRMNEQQINSEYKIKQEQYDTNSFQYIEVINRLYSRRHIYRYVILDVFEQVRQYNTGVVEVCV